MHRERPQTPTRLKVRRPDDLLAVIPYLLGFHPDESLVAVFVRSGRVILTARMDLLPEAGDELGEQIDAVAQREGSQALALVAYSAAALSANRLLARLMDRLAEHDLTDVLYVGHGRWWSLTCGDECCPLVGTPLDLTSHPLSATAVLAGLVTRANRDELEASIGGPLPAEMPRLQSITETLLSEVTQLEEAGGGVRVMLSMLDTAVADPNSLDERTCLLLGLMLRRIELRDRAWILINPANADDHVRLWGAVVARVPPTLAAAPLCLLGMAAWLDGDGALLNCCCGRLAVVAPDYSMGILLAEISERALSPSIWQELGSEVQGGSQKHPAPLTS